MAQAVTTVSATVRTTGRAGISWFALGTGFLTAVALFLRLQALRKESLWMDEGYTLLFSRLPLPQLLTVGGAHEHPPLYYLLVHTALALHNDALIPRFIASLSSTCSVVAIAALGRRLFGPVAGLTAAALLTVSPLHVWFGQDGRAYALAGLCVVLSYLLATSSTHWIWYGLVTAAALYTEYTTALALAPQVLLLAQRPRRATVARGWMLAALLFAPWIGTLALDASHVASNYWIPMPRWENVWQTALEFLNMSSPCTSPPCRGVEAPVPLLAGHEGLVAACAILLFAAVTIAAIVIRNFRIALITAWLIVPFGVVLAIAPWRPLYLDRIFLDASFPVYLLIGAGVASATVRVVSIAAAILMMVLGVLTTQAFQHTATNPDWKTPSSDLVAAYRPGEAVVYYPGVLAQIVHAYAPLNWHPSYERPVWFHTYLDVPGWQNLRRLTDFQLRDRQLSGATAHSRSVWLVAQGYTGLAFARQWFAVHGFKLILSETYHGVTRIELYRRGPPRGRLIVAPWFGRHWVSAGRVLLHGKLAILDGVSMVSRDVPIHRGAYTVNLRYRGLPPAGGQVQVQVYNAAGKLLATYPRTQWYDLPPTGAWYAQPFGFVAPDGAVRARLVLKNWWGESRWRNVVMRQESNDA